MARTKSRTGPKANRQKTIQVLDFATKLHREITTSLKENRTVVASAAMLAFSKLPLTDQLDMIHAARERHATAGVEK